MSDEATQKADLRDLETFDKNKLKRTNTVVKRHLPTKEDIAKEKEEIETEKRNSGLEKSTQTEVFYIYFFSYYGLMIF
jgi:hypothetical protein